MASEPARNAVYPAVLGELPEQGQVHFQGQVLRCVAQDENAAKKRNLLDQLRGAMPSNSDELKKRAAANAAQDAKGIAADPMMLEIDQPTSDDRTNEDQDGFEESAFEDDASPRGDQQDAMGQAGPNNVAAPRLNTLALPDVVASVRQSYPTIIQARQQAELQRGKLTEAWGSFDTKLKLESLNEPTGFYENYRHAVGASRQTWNGGSVYGGYRIGRGSFQPWYKERETDEGGELKAGIRQSLMQGRAIDPARVAVYQAALRQKAVAPGIANALRETFRDASLQYWEWVESGLVLESQRSLLELAEKRGKQYEAGVNAGKFPEIDLILNQQLIAERKAKLIETQQKFQANAFKLSLYLRDANGNPLVPEKTLMPNAFPSVSAISAPNIDEELAVVVGRRPETQQLELERRKLQYDLALARNQTQPVLDFIGEVSQDMGQDASSSEDKDQFLVVLGVQGELPIQRRKARGKYMAVHAKLAQLAQKQRFLTDKIRAELSIGFNELQRDAEVVEQALASLEAARETLNRYRFAFQKGTIDLIYLNLLEVKANESEIKYLTAQKNWHIAMARLKASLGLEPLRPLEVSP